MKSIALLTLIAALSCQAETVTALVDQAIKTNPELRFYNSEITAAKAGKATASQYANPDLSTNLGRKSITHPSGERGESGPIWRAELAQTFDFPGRIALRKAIADRDISLAELGLLQFRTLLGNQVRKHAGDIILLRKQADATRAVRERIAEVIAVLVQRDTGNISAKLERRMLEASLLTHDHALTQADKEAASSVATLNLLCGRAPDAELQLGDETITLPAAPTLAALKERAAIGNFELLQKRVQLARQGLRIDLSKSERWGSIKFGPYTEGEKYGDELDTVVGLSLSIPLPLWNKGEGAIAAEKARQAGAQAMLAATLRDLERDLTIQRQGYAAELTALTRWQPETESEFKSAAEDADHHYRLGAVPATTYLEMQRGYLEALTALIDTRRQAWLHRMELERLIGGSLEGEK
jgi:outer membrane protein, heavy metal efflux system